MKLWYFFIHSIFYFVQFTFGDPSTLDILTVNMRIGPNEGQPNRHQGKQMRISDYKSEKGHVFRRSDYEGSNDDSYEYASDDEIEEEATAKKDEGTRLVGARSSKNDLEVPFVVGLDLKGSGFTTCTGSLISPRWIVTAAHCTALLPERQPRLIKKCVSSGRGQKDGVSFTCKRLPDGSLEYGNIEPQGIAWLGLSSIREKHKAEEKKVSTIVRHKYTYFGGARYGKNGGYDISLLQMDTATRRPPACIPSPEFNDNVVSKLAGYGKFLRDGGRTCQTDEQGLMKFHYCKQEGGGSEICKKGAPPQHPKCKILPKVEPNIYQDKHSDEYMTGEIELVENGKSIATCFTHPVKNRGWCPTQGNYYDLDNPQENFEGWGYCSNDCFLDEEASQVGESGVLRVKEPVDVLSDKLCNEFLERSLDAGPPRTRPEVLCVGLVKNFTSTAYTSDGQFLKGKKPIHQFDFFQRGFYVTSGGTCNGDSGGPLYVKQESKYIVTGAVSGGRGSLGRCGGINNPVHYARIKKFGKWIATIAGEEAKDICWAD